MSEVLQENILASVVVALAITAALEATDPPQEDSDKPRCKNSRKGLVCERPPLQGHIFCNECRIATGGYNRYPKGARSLKEDDNEA